MKITNTHLYDFVHTDEKKFVHAMAIEHACANMGMENLLDECDDIDGVRQQLLECHYDAEITNETSFGRRSLSGPAEARAERIAEEAVSEEVGSWMEDARKTLEVIKKENLPWSLRSSRIVFERPGYLRDK